MSVTNGQIANATTFNSAFVSRTVDATKAGKLNMTDVTEAGADAGALRLQGGLYVAKNIYAAALVQALGGMAINAGADAAATGSLQEVTLTKPFTVFTNNSLVSIQALTYGTQTFAGIIFLKNGTTGKLTFVNNTGTAGKRISTGTGKNLKISTGAVIMLIYDIVNSIWCVAGGSGGGGGGQENFTIANNQSSPANVTGLLLNNAEVRSALVEWNVTRITTSTGAVARVQRGSFFVVWDGTAWAMTLGPDSGTYAGVDFDIDPSTGQVTYVSDNQSGTPSISTLSYNIIDQTEGV